MLVFCGTQALLERFLTVPLAKALKFALLAFTNQVIFFCFRVGFVLHHQISTVYENETHPCRPVPLPQGGGPWLFPITLVKERDPFPYVKKIQAYIGQKKRGNVKRAHIESRGLYLAWQPLIAYRQKVLLLRMVFSQFPR